MAHLGLPPNILAMFNPRPPLEYWPPAKKGKFPAYTGVAQFVNLFEDPATAPPPPAWRPPESRRKREERLKREKQEKHEQELRKALEEWDPHKDPNVEGDPKATLFVARINYETTEAKLRREFEQFGPIKRIRIVTDKTTGKPRGYAFIEFESPNDMKNAYKYADGRKIDGRRVVVDYERGRTVRNWRPRRLGGGLGNTRAGGPPGGGSGGAGGGPSSTPYYGDDRSRGDSGR
eukprot:GEZU01031429.1.p2 GENE.GEZU01031429.1~~GEZU01031429.1.p2  ORF type:complete len:233 (+),score=59.20 GEZU01031429.1:109-807(+)